jgi:hypothetical protein
MGGREYEKREKNDFVKGHGFASFSLTKFNKKLGHFSQKDFKTWKAF